MTERSFLGSLCSDLEIVLKDGSWSDKALLVELSKVQRNLHSSRAADLGQAVVALKGYYSESEDVNSTCPEGLQPLTMTLVSILECDSDHVSHSASKALVALSHYLHDAPSWWTLFLHILWRALKAWSGDLAKYASLREEDSSCEAGTAPYLSAKHIVLQQRTNCTAALQALHVLHNILTNCKQEGTLKLKTFLCVSGLYIGEVVAAFITEAVQPSNASLKLEYKEEVTLGALLRLLCSVIHSMSLHSDILKAADFMVESQILTSAQSFISEFSYYCLVPHDNSSLSHYVRHKFLMLLFRLREWFTENPSLTVTCLEILKSHTDDLLGSLFQRPAQWASPSLGSPFDPCLTQSNKVKRPVTTPFSQLERHAVFLVFKAVVSLRKKSHHVSPGIHRASESGVLMSEEQRATQMEKWLHSYLLMQIDCMGDISSSAIAEVADGLTQSFVQIFVEEDTLMLETLLLLLDIPKLEVFSPSSNAADKSLQVAHSLLLAIFNPVRLFAVFLLMVCYDHSIILDFLISKDTGTLCLQYLIRCLRIVHNTWPDFLFLSATERRKDRSYMSKGEKKVQAECKLDLVSTLSRERKRKSPCISDTTINLQKAATCLVSLKFAVQRLHQKHVFPYNPSALLKHLDLFQELGGFKLP